MSEEEDHFGENAEYWNDERVPPTDPKARVVEIVTEWMLSVDEACYIPKEYRNGLADRLDSAGLLASAPVVPSVEELERVIGQTDLRGPGMSHQYAQAIRNHLLTIGWREK